MHRRAKACARLARARRWSPLIHNLIKGVILTFPAGAAVLAAIILLVAPIGLAQLPSNPATADTSNTAAEAARVYVTGSNIPTAEGVGPSPLDTYTSEDIEKLGAHTATDLTQALPVITGSYPNQNQSFNATGSTQVNLRGLLPKETLALIDGRRRGNLDINGIPFPLIDHIDILKDGASAIYGSDAVAGVYNVVLKHRFRDVEIGASYGNTNLGSSNDAAEREAYILAGTGDDKTDIVVFAEYYDRDAIFSRDRDISSSFNYIRFGGTDNRSVDFPGGVRNFILRPGLTTPTPHSAPKPFKSPEYVLATSLPRQQQLFDTAPYTSAVPEADRQYVYGSIVRDLFEKYLTVFADFEYTHSFFEPVAAPVPFEPDPFRDSNGIWITPPGTGISVPISNPFNPFTRGNAILPDGTPVFTGVRYRELAAGPRLQKRTGSGYLLDAGTRGNLGEFGDYFKTWNFEFNFRYNWGENEFLYEGLVSAPALRAALLDPNPATAFNPFGRNVNTRAALKRVVVSTHETTSTPLTDELASLNGDIIEFPAGPISFALGSEHRRNTLSVVPDLLTASFNTIGAFGQQAASGSRDVYSYFGELRIPITSPSWNFPGAYSLEFQAAERIEDFSDVGNSEKPKFSLRYQPVDASLTLRATYSEAFHAPLLVDLSPAASEGAAFVRDPAHPGAPGAVVSELSGGNPNLRPEVAYGFTYGAVWSPRFVKGLTLSTDFYHIDLRDRTNFIDPQFIVNENFASGGKRFPGQVVRDPVTGNIVQIRDLTQNISRTITEGIDYEAVYRLDTAVFGGGGFGTFTFTLNGNYLSRYVASLSVGDREREYAGKETGFAGYLPHNRFYGSLFYDQGGLDTGLTVHYIGQGSDFPFTTKDGLPRKIREWTTLDALVSYTFRLLPPALNNEVAGYAKDGGKTTDGKDKNVLPLSTAEYTLRGWRAWLNRTRITLGVNNIFDLDPPFSGGGGENGYDESTFNIKGRYCYVAVKKRF